MVEGEKNKTLKTLRSVLNIPSPAASAVSRQGPLPRQVDGYLTHGTL